jgi:hypothetical protein
MSAGKVTLERIISLAYVCLSWCGTMRAVMPAKAVTSWRQERSRRIKACLPSGRDSSQPSGGRGSKERKNAGAARAHIQMRLPAPFVPSSACPEEREWRTARARHSGGNHRRDRLIHQYACRYGGVTRRYLPADHCGGATPAGLVDPAVPSRLGANVEEGAESLRDG